MKEEAGPLMEKVATQFEDSVNLKQMIEDNIAAFDLDRLEAIVKQVASGKFRTIERLGALLGFVIGCLQVTLLLGNWFDTFLNHCSDDKLSINLLYCDSRFQTRRRATRAINVGGIYMGGDNPIRIQSMTTTKTQDIDATVAQTLALAEAGCEIVRITAPNKAAATALGEISKKVRPQNAKYPLVADIPFPSICAMEAAKYVEKIRINPGNYADKKKFAILEYSDAEYNEELERLNEVFSPIVLRCKELGRAMRGGTNHGSLSDRIMNRYGDTPLGMVECALDLSVLPRATITKKSASL